MPAIPRFPLLAPLALALSALALAGCAVGPDYQRPDGKLPGSYQASELLAGSNAAAVPLDAWWQGFADPSLTRLIERALAQNLDLAASYARLTQARAAARRAGAELLPQGAFDAQAARRRSSIESPAGALANGVLPDYDRNQSDYAVGAGASWEIDLAGGLARGAEAAGALAEAARAEHANMRVSIAAEVADAYFRLRGAQSRIAIAREQIATSEDLLGLVELRLRDGLATSREQAQAQALVYQTRATLPPLQAELTAQANRLDVLMGAAPGTYTRELAADIPASVAADVLQVPAPPLAQGPADLLRRRPDVIAAERRLAAANAEIGVAIAEYYPRLSLSALLGFESMQSGTLFTAAALQPEIGAGLHWRLFDFGRVDAEIEQARGRYAEALAQYRQSMLRATEDVENAVVSLVRRQAQSHELAQEIAAHRTALSASREAYQGGAVSLIEVLDEDRLLLAARDQLAQANTGQALAAVAAFRALGGGWDAASPAPRG